MLVLTRKHQEKIRIGDQITITVLKTKGKAVRLGIDAPSDIVVIRGELAVDGVPPRPRLASQSDERPIGRVEATSRDRHTPQQSMRAASAWGTPDLQSCERTQHDPPAVEVSLRRVPRDQAAQILPVLATGGRPLQEMLERRATVE